MHLKVNVRLSLIGSFTIGTLMGCGTQIGNPTGASQARLLTDSPSIESFLTAGFLQTVDGLNMGDYSYSNSESRIVSLRQCRNRDDRGLALVQKAAASHSVDDRGVNYFARSAITIERNYEDTWFQSQRPLPCDTSVGVKFDYAALANGELRLESSVNEVLQRNMTLTYDSSKEPIRHNLQAEKSGTRTLSLVAYEETAGGVRLKAKLDNRLTTKLGLQDRSEAAEMRLSEGQPLAFDIVLDRSSLLWTSYQITQARQEFVLSSGERLRLDFSNVVFTRAATCTPVSGELTATVLYDGALPQVYRGQFVAGQPLTLTSTDGRSPALLVAPFACVLKER